MDSSSARVWKLAMRRFFTMFLGLLSACSADTGPGRTPEPNSMSASASASASATASAAATASASVSASASVPAPAEAASAPRMVSGDEARFDAAVSGAIQRGEIPGAVLVVLRKGRVALRKAYGLRVKEPTPVPMTVDTVFDLASLTKPIATATTIHLLAERKKLRLSDRVARYLPDFTGDGRERVTIADLLLHVSGLPAVDAISNYSNGRESARNSVRRAPLAHPPGEAYVYSDLGYILLGEIAERVSGEPLNVFSKKNLFGPLDMADTGFSPGPELAARAAPTERVEGSPGNGVLTGEVHDPRARALGGVAGHAGLFSTAEDLTRFVQMILGRGAFKGRRILAPESVMALTTPRPFKDGAHALGFGQLFSGVGHTGFTGTALWFDMSRGDAVILLASRLYPDGKGDAKRVRREVAEIASTLEDAPSVRAGVDMLAAQGFRPLEGRRVGLITNHTGRDARGERTIDILARAPNLRMVAVFSPEHGIGGDHDRPVIKDGKDTRTGLPVYSLYGETKRPTDAQLAGIDALVFDVQDAGVRFYTYISTLGYALEEAARRKIKFVVLDRPNPLGGAVIEGPMLDPGRESFVGYHALPIRHGMTVGELARLFNAERKLGAELEVVRMEGWRRSDRFDDTGLPWVNPSPNLRSPAAALLYPGIGMLELTNVSVGRGTEKPFERIGAPFVDGDRLAKALAAEDLPWVRFVPIRFTPSASTYVGEACGGVAFDAVDPDRADPVLLGFVIARALRRLYPDVWDPKGLLPLVGNRRVVDALARGAGISELFSIYEKDLQAFVERRKQYLLY